MSSAKTDSLQLNKWVPTDYVSMSEFNDNFQKIDDAHKGVTTQLTDTKMKISDTANAESCLSILSPYNYYDNTHPKVLYFENRWNGYKFWMAYTPYKLSAIKDENPCIAVSNDGVTWITPAGLTNPIEDWTGVYTQYNNDPHLVYRSDTNTMELWFRLADTGNSIGYLKRKTSTNGINWTTTEVLYQGIVELDDHISPAVIYEDSKYKMLSVYRKNGKWTVCYRESSDAIKWSARQDINIILPSNVQPWHLDFIKAGNQYEMITTGFNPAIGETNNHAKLYFAKSNNLIDWGTAEVVVSPSGVGGSFDGQGIYRSTFVKIKEKYHLYYSGVGLSEERGIGLSTGENMFKLVGQNPYDTKKTVLIKNATGSGVELTPSNTLNKMDIRQVSNPNRYGHLSVGTLFLEDRLTNTSTPKDGAVGYSSLAGIIQKYQGTWRGLNTNGFFKLTNAISLENGTLTGIPFNSVITPSVKYNGSTGVYTPVGEEYLKISVGVTITDAPNGSIELSLVNATDNSIIGTLSKKTLSPVDGVEYINGTFVTYVSVPFKIGINYRGTSTPRITQYVTQNFLLIENI